MQNLRLDYKQCRYFRHYFKDLLRIDDKKVNSWHAKQQGNNTKSRFIPCKNMKNGLLKYQVNTTFDVHFVSLIDSINS